MWVICGIDGFRHYRHCLEYATDSFVDAYDALTGLDKKTLYVPELFVLNNTAFINFTMTNFHDTFYIV